MSSRGYVDFACGEAASRRRAVFVSYSEEYLSDQAVLPVALATTRRVFCW